MTQVKKTVKTPRKPQNLRGVFVRLEPELLRQLDREIRLTGATRAAFVRLLIEQSIKS